MQACHAQMMDFLAEYAIVAGRRRIKINKVARAVCPRNWQ
jgi:hypothetical protein